MTVIAKGLEGVVAAETAISDVRGTEGQLIYRGYDINELAGHVSFEEVVYMLWHNDLPNKKELEFLSNELCNERDLPEGIVEFLLSCPKDANPMDVIRTAVSMLGLYDTGEVGNDSMDLNRRRALSITAKVGVITAYFHRARQGQPLLPVRKDLGEAAHFLYLLTGMEPGPEAVKTLDLAYVLHADHGMNASTFSARVTISTLTDIYSAVTAAIGTLKGPLHGGANEGVIRMLLEIGDEDKVDAWVAEQLAMKRKIMGIGHRVYKTLDPRAPHLKRMAIELTRELGEPKWIRMSERIAQLMLEQKGLHANVDFYSATVYYSLGIPLDLFTPIFAISRTSGWTAHILEQLSNNRLFRPQSEYVGPAVGKKVVPLANRS
ncbi:MAG: citrate synthase [Blastochloris sp.]|nr:citrate synthase [Blastochloris sp.]